MFNGINSNYSMYQKTTGQVGGKRGAGKKDGADAKKDADFGADFGVELSKEGLNALEAQKQKFAVNRKPDADDDFLTEGKLSDKAKDFLSKLREKYGDKYDFFAVSSIEDPRAMKLTGTKAYSVVLTNDEIEKMANDEEYAEEVMKKVESAVDMTKRIEEKGELGEGVKFKHISIAFDNDGNMKLFAELEKMSERQQERMEKAKERRAEEKEEAERKEKAPHERPLRVRLEAASEEELLEKIAGIDWEEVAAKRKEKKEDE